MTINELKSQLARFRIKPSHKLGQNFLLSEKVLETIVTAAELKNTDTVLEIGPGLGALTRRLGERAAEVIAIEKDRKLAAALRKMFSAKGGSSLGGKNKRNVKIIQGDALFIGDSNTRMHADDTNSNSRHSSGDSSHSSRSFKVVANIPYYITGKLLQNFLAGDSNTRMHANDTNSNSRHSSGDSSHSSRSRPSLMVLLLQKEVAERIVAGPGEMSVLSVSVQFYADPEIISVVPRENFYPVPEVDSAVIRLKVLDKPRFDLDEKIFFHLVKIGFSNKRKMPKNNLTPFFSPPREGELEGVAEQNTMTSPSPSSRGGGRIQDILSSIGLNPLCRAQDLSLEQWKLLYEKLKFFP